MRLISQRSLPKPMIIWLRFVWLASGEPPSLNHRRPHFGDRGRKANKNRFANKKVPDIKFNDLWHPGDFACRIEIKAMACMTFDTAPLRMRGGGCDPPNILSELISFPKRGGITPSACMQFDNRGANRHRGFDGLDGWLDKKRDSYSSAGQLGHEGF